MRTEIKQLRISSKLPGYLYVLSCITAIDEKIILECPTMDYEYICSMLNFIGIKIASSVEKCTEKHKCLYVHANNKIIADTIFKDILSQCVIIDINKKDAEGKTQQFLDKFLLRHPDSIVVINIESGVSTKYFFIKINTRNKYYEKIQKRSKSGIMY